MSSLTVKDNTNIIQDYTLENKVTAGEVRSV